MATIPVFGERTLPFDWNFVNQLVESPRRRAKPLTSRNVQPQAAKIAGHGQET
jgi:hypothetical protein